MAWTAYSAAVQVCQKIDVISLPIEAVCTVPRSKRGFTP